MRKLLTIASLLLIVGGNAMAQGGQTGATPTPNHIHASVSKQIRQADTQGDGHSVPLKKLGYRNKNLHKKSVIKAKPRYLPTTTNDASLIHHQP